MIRPGELNERVTIQQASEARNAFGEAVLSWDTFAERWAKVEGVTFRESLQAGQQQTDITHRVRMRYLAGLTGKMRIMWRGRVLEIISVLEHDSRSVHEIVCQEAA
jgi:SPP1 family predicted phage head-tail adaptor